MKNNNPNLPVHPTVEELEQELKRVRTRRGAVRTLRSTVLSLALIAAVAVFAAMFLPVLRIQGESMEPTLNRGDLVITAGWSDCAPGDIVCFHSQDKVMVKRLIAEAGDVVNILEDGTVEVNGVTLAEDYVLNASRGELDIEMPFTVPEGQCFVMGDNREVSVDSRSTAMGCIPEAQLEGRAILRIWPLNRLSWLAGRGGEG